MRHLIFNTKFNYYNDVPEYLLSIEEEAISEDINITVEDEDLWDAIKFQDDMPNVSEYYIGMMFDLIEEYITERSSLEDKDFFRTIGGRYSNIALVSDIDNNINSFSSINNIISRYPIEVKNV